MSEERTEHFDDVYNQENHFTVRHKAVLITFALCLLLIVVGVIEFGWVHRRNCCCIFYNGSCSWDYRWIKCK